MQRPRANTFHLAILFFLANLLLKLLFLGSRDIAIDEPFSIWWAQHDLPGIFSMLKTENNPALHFLLLHFWIKLFGIGPFAVRLPSAIFSSLTAGLIFYTGERFRDRITGAFAALIFTFSTMQVGFSHEARVYPLFELLAAWNLFLCLSISEEPRRNKWFAWLLLCDLLLVYSHYLGWIAVGTQVIIMISHPSRRLTWKPLLAILCLLVICYLPGFQILFERFAVSSKGTWVPNPHSAELYGNINRFLNSRWVTFVLLLTALAGIVLAAAKRKLSEVTRKILTDRTFHIILLFFLLPYLFMFAVSLKFPIFLDRYLLFTTPAAYLAIASCYRYLPVQTGTRIFLFIPMLAMMAWFFTINPDNNRRVADLARTVKMMQNQQDLILISPEYSDLEFAYYYDHPAFRDYRNTRHILNGEKVFPVRSVGQLRPGLIDSANHVLYIDCGSAFAYGQDIPGIELSQRFRKGPVTEIYQIYKIQEFHR